MTNNGKHTIYVDVDDEITAIIDKVKTAPDKIVALVLPKRATVLQSIVNMKLLKKSATASKKNLVLITSEAGLMPLAGAVGLHVAKSLQSKPEIPLPPSQDEEMSEISEPNDDKADEPLEQVAKKPAAAVLADDDTETIELDDVGGDEAAVEKNPIKRAKKAFKVPNFDRFRTGFFLAILAVILLIAGWVFAATVLPTATIAIDTDSTTVVTNVDFTANTEFKDLNLEKAEVPAILKETKKSDTEKVTATGKKDNGEKATGTMTLTNCIRDDVSHTVPAGTGFSSGNLTFVTDEDVTLPVSTFQGNTCRSANVGDSKTVDVTAASGGTNYNLDARSYNSPIAGVLASGSAMSGGTTNIVTVVSQSDIDGAISKMKGRFDAEAKQNLLTTLKTDGLKALDETFTTSAPAVTATPALNAEAEEVTVKAETAYSILGIKTDYLSKLVKKNAQEKIDESKQSILDDGLADAPIRITNKRSPTDLQMTVQALVVAGPELDADAIKEEIKGKKRGDVEKLIKEKTGVRDVTITYKPFWVLSTPKSVKKITIVIEKPEASEKTETEQSNP